MHGDLSLVRLVVRRDVAAVVVRATGVLWDAVETGVVSVIMFMVVNRVVNLRSLSAWCTVLARLPSDFYGDGSDRRVTIGNDYHTIEIFECS